MRTDVTGTVRYRMRKSHRGGSSIRLLVECAEHSVWLTWPEDADTARPGDTVTATVDLAATARPGTMRGSRLANPRRIGRQHEQLLR